MKTVKTSAVFLNISGDSILILFIFLRITIKSLRGDSIGDRHWCGNTSAVYNFFYITKHCILSIYHFYKYAASICPKAAEIFTQDHKTWHWHARRQGLSSLQFSGHSCIALPAWWSCAALLLLTLSDETTCACNSMLRALSTASGECETVKNTLSCFCSYCLFSFFLSLLSLYFYVLFIYSSIHLYLFIFCLCVCLRIFTAILQKYIVVEMCSFVVILKQKSWRLLLKCSNEQKYFSLRSFFLGFCLKLQVILSSMQAVLVIFV